MNNQYSLNLFGLIIIFVIFSFPSFSQQSIIDSLERILPEISASKEKVNTLVYLSYQWAEIDTEKAMDYASEALSISQKEGYKKGILQSYIQLAGNNATLGKLKIGLEMLDKGEPLAILEKDSNVLMQCYSLRTAYNAALGDLDKAMIAALDHLRLAELTDNKEEMGNVLISLGFLNADAGKQDYPKALGFFLEGAQIFEEINEEEYLAHALLNIGAVYDEMGDSEKAIKVVKRAIEICERIDRNAILPNLYSVLSNANYNLNNKEVAIDYMRKSVAIFKETNNPRELCQSTLKLAQYLNEKGEYDEALINLLEVKPLLKVLDRIVYYQPYYEQLAFAQKAKKDYENAFANYVLSMNWKDSSYQELKLKEFEEIQTKYETEKKEQENIVLTQQNDFLASQNQLYTYIGIGLALIIAILSWLFYKLKKQNQIIQTQKSKLEELNATKDRLFAIIAHDMRNAVHSFRDVTDSISFFIKRKQPERIEKIAGAVEKSIDQLGRLLDNLLEWALVQRGDMPYQPELLNLTDSIREVLENFEGMAERKEVILETDIDADTQIFADKNALETIVRNLVSNALKFSNSGGKVKISAIPQNENALIQIQDNGIGMNAEQIEKLFQPSKNKSKIGTAGEKGSGLGLVLVKELVELNKGKINVEAEEGRGAKFVFSLPKAA